MKVETKVEICGYGAQHKHLIPTIKHGGGGVMILSQNKTWTTAK